MSNTTASEKVMERVARLLALAEHPNTPVHEAELALKQANSLITKHAIDEALLRQSQSVSERRAIHHMTVVLGGGEFQPYLRTIFEAAAETFRVSVASKYSREHMGTEFHLYGANEDVVWLDMLYNMIKLQFLTKLDPTWDNSLSYDNNVYNFKVAGFKWAEIDAQAIAHGHARNESTNLIDTIESDDSRAYWERRIEWRRNCIIVGDQVREYNGFFHKLKAAYVRHAKLIGDDSRVATQSHQAYRLSFAEAFRSTMTERLWQMQRDNEASMDTIPGAALALRDMKEDADRRMWEDFPGMSPEEVERRRKAYQDQVDAERKAREDMLAAMTPQERQKFLENEEAEARKEAKRQRAWEKKNTRYYTYDQTALSMGRSAANSVDLTRKAGHAGQGATRGELG
jgi:hypothetical protein